MAGRIPLSAYALHPRTMGTRAGFEYKLYLAKSGDPETLSVAVLEQLLRVSVCAGCGMAIGELGEHDRCRSEPGTITLRMPFSERLALSKTLWKENVRIRHKRRWMLERAAANPFTAADVGPLYEAQDGRCYYCGNPLQTQGLSDLVHRDHMVPVAKGGSHEVTNIVLACRACNTDKGFATATSYCIRLARRMSLEQREIVGRIRKAVKRWKAARVKARR